MRARLSVATITTGPGFLLDGALMARSASGVAYDVVAGTLDAAATVSYCCIGTGFPALPSGMERHKAADHG